MYNLYSGKEATGCYCKSHYIIIYCYRQAPQLSWLQLVLLENKNLFVGAETLFHMCAVTGI